MNDTANNSSAPSFDPYPFDLAAILKLAVTGALTGAVGWLLYLAITQYFIEPVFCQSVETFGICRNGGTVAWLSAHVVVFAAAVAVLARLAVYRPLLIVLAMFACLWGANAWLGGMSWYMGLVWQAALFGTAMAVFGWLARIPNFLVSVVSIVALTVLARVVLMLG